MTIQLLSDSLINKIAAGEVIEKPASVIKELVENSLDAGATAVKVSIKNGGLDLIEVEDDGQGMSFEEIPLAFLRHATSKINKEEDLYNIHTMGFRGEALPSIASVSRVELYTKTVNHDGVHARLEGGRMDEHEYHACPEGTRLIVRELFFNTPARKKFIKSPVSEGNQVYDLITRYALARPEVCFSFNNEKRTYFKTPGNGSLRDTVISIYGSDFASHLLDISYISPSASLTGLIGRPELVRANRRQEMLFVNQRPVRSALLYRAVEAAYAGFLLAREFPVVILTLQLPPDSVDVNVHPQKSEVRFQDEKAVFQIVQGVLKDALVSADSRPGEYIFKQPISYNYMPSPPSAAPLFREQNVFQNSSGFEQSRPTAFNSIDYIGLPHNEALEVLPGDELKIIGQVLNSYIVIEHQDALWLVDQHAAHERILYSYLIGSASAGEEAAQILAIPLSIELSSREMETVEQHREVFAAMGFHLESLGPNTLVIRSVPTVVAGNEEEILREVLEMLTTKRDPDIKQRAVTMMACKKAIKAGEVLRHYEMEKLLIDLLRVPDYKNCPHGRPTMVKLDHHDLDRMFKR
ncbi:DNA mismatch repair endonuclease MutL [Syntrophomonas palmitatica]|uniref:DNA mismatch repair endonuclease MutL n=1 Tax=Syntrophomonas palmitatica TaxID=402877 RepID=UPI0006D0A83A|nr:DNA mismatch repair endonuclease MutL [Syntrophomonas palmitatica]